MLSINDISISDSFLYGYMVIAV